MGYLTETTSTIDLTGINYFLPIVTFVLVFIISYAVLNKTKIFENKGVELFVAFLVSTLFITFVNARVYIEMITPWFVILLVSLFFILVMTGFVGKDADKVKKGFGIAFIFILFAVFLISAFFVYSSVISPYLPGGESGNANPYLLTLFSQIFSSKFGGALALILVGILVSWILVKAGNKK